MRRSLRTVFAAAATAALGVTLSAGPAAAQYPGENGRTSYVATVDFALPCFTAYWEEAAPPFNYVGHRAGSIAYSPDGEHVAVIAHAPSYSVGVWVVHIPTCSARSLSTGESYEGLAWSPDGTELAVGGDGIRILDTSSGALVRTLATTGVNPTWSPRGSHIAYDDGASVWTAPARARITPNGRTPGARQIIDDAVDPDFSPDGKRIAFIRDNRIGHAKASSGADQKLLPEDVHAYEVVWSPDGQYFLFSGSQPAEDHNVDCAITTVAGVYQRSPGTDPPCYSVAWQPLPVTKGAGRR